MRITEEESASWFVKLANQCDFVIDRIELNLLFKQNPEFYPKSKLFFY